jgi:hypothetical protein
MKNFSSNAAQGEISIRKIDELPSGVKPLAAENGKFIIGHSETGHHHTMTMERAKVFEATNTPDGMKILYAILDGEKVLQHERSFDTHEPIQFQPGIYEFRLGREYDPYAELARKQAD